MNTPFIPFVTVSQKAEKVIARAHPWIFSGAVRGVHGPVSAGDTVAVRSMDGRHLGWGAFSPQSQIRVRVWSFTETEKPDDNLIGIRLEKALLHREQSPIKGKTTAMRLVNAESDGLPGLIVDAYDDFLVCQFLSAGVEHWRPVIVDHLRRLRPVSGIYERSDADARLKEGLAARNGVLWGQPPPDLVEVVFNNVRFLVDIINGHKTGFYLDQRENHALIMDYAESTDMLNCFSYSGAFSLCALTAGADRVTNIDASRPALDLAARNLALNGLDNTRMEQIAGNAFEILRGFRDRNRRFDLIVLDPPKFVASAGQLNKGTRGYKDINLLAFKLLKPGGVLFTFSCSGLVSSDLFQKIVADAALDAGRRATIIRYLSQAADHAVALSFPEGLYLKGLICQVEP